MDHPRARTRRRAPLWMDLTVLAVIGVLLFGALTAGGITLYRQFYSPSAFVTHYIDLLARGQAADALQLPGVASDSSTLEEAGIDGTASEALLRKAALTSISDVTVDSETTDGEITTVTVSYTAGGEKGTSSFTVRQDGWTGVTPNWRFDESPLAAIQLTLRGANEFSVNGFEMDRRQVSVDGAEAADLDPLPLLVFTPGLYSISVDTAISVASGVDVLADTPLATTPVDVQTQPTEKFVSVVQDRVDEFLTQCATQQVMKPTACPFGFSIRNQIASLPQWSITTSPTITVEPDGGQWSIPVTNATAHIDVEVRSFFDGSINKVSEDVPFQITGTITILADGSASIRVGSPGE